ncbi:MAG: hypothetical protein V1844_01410 [Pseudomonadota bacterium]
MAKKKKPSDSLTDLLAGVQQEILVDLIVSLAQNRLDVRSACFDYLKKHANLTHEQKTRSEGEIVMALWAELSPDLEELDGYGGGPKEMENSVTDLLYDIEKRLNGKLVEEKFRRTLLDEVLPFIISGNAGLDDMLYDLAYATCYNNEDLRGLAQAFETMNSDWPRDHARRIYRKIGNREKYLELRHKKLEYGGDYHDLVTFYWNEGNRSQALSVAEEGMKKGKGRMDELRLFMADRARESGNREQYLQLQFDQAADHLTLENYKKFKQICTEEEWQIYESKLLEKLNRAWASNQLDILMERKDYKEALAVLIKEKYPNWESGSVPQTAKKLEPRFPDQILAYYLSGFNNMNRETTRKGYAARAKIMLKIRRLMVDVMKDENRWKILAGKIKQENLRRPAFQEEFARVVPGWRDLGME